MEMESKFSVSPIDDGKRSPWPLKDIFYGFSIPLAFFVIIYTLDHINSIRYRPWIAGPFSIALGISAYIGLFLCSVHICRKRGLWPLVVSMSGFELCKEFIKSLLALLLIMLAVGLVGNLLSMILKTPIEQPKIWQWISYAPNSYVIVTFLIMGFTIAPVVEEIFFRGFFYNALKTRFPIFLAAIIQAVFFSFLHGYELLNAFLVALIGIALAIVYEKRKNLLSPIFVHGIMNAIVIIPILVLTLENFHGSSTTWDEAEVPPKWFETDPPYHIQRKKDGIEQWQYAIDTWGSKGSRQWKIEANAFNAVCTWFPEDRKACAKARLGIITIYNHYLKDYRRAIVETDRLLSEYPEQREECASALSKKGWSYYMLRDFLHSRETFNMVMNDYREYKSAFESSEIGVRWLNALGK
jgi:membrane protease YdiL (CAAX protease family)